MSDSTRHHSMVDNLCIGVDKYDNSCIKYNSEYDTTHNLSNVDMAQYNNDDVIKGDINILGWVIIKSELIDSSSEDAINKPAYSDNHWSKISNQPNRQMRFNSLDNQGIK